MELTQTQILILQRLHSHEKDLRKGMAWDNRPLWNKGKLFYRTMRPGLTGKKMVLKTKTTPAKETDVLDLEARGWIKTRPLEDGRVEVWVSNDALPAILGWDISKAPAIAETIENALQGIYFDS
jgi:hypothetical protein